jgi:hypothetical protein
MAYYAPSVCDPVVSVRPARNPTGFSGLQIIELGRYLLTAEAGERF